MTKAAFISIRLSVALVSSSLPACATDDADEDLASLAAAATGNGALSGPHFNLNIIGVQKGKSPNLTGGDGHRIFVPLVGTAKINLTEGTDFQVLDANAT